MLNCFISVKSPLCGIITIGRLDITYIRSAGHLGDTQQRASSITSRSPAALGFDLSLALSHLQYKMQEPESTSHLEIMLHLGVERKAPSQLQVLMGWGLQRAAS